MGPAAESGHWLCRDSSVAKENSVGLGKASLASKLPSNRGVPPGELGSAQEFLYQRLVCVCSRKDRPQVKAPEDDVHC